MKWNIHSNYGAQQANNQESKMKESDFLNLYNLWRTQKKKKKKNLLAVDMESLF